MRSPMPYPNPGEGARAQALDPTTGARARAQALDPTTGARARALVLDPTAGERARAIRMGSALPQLVVDPTDTRCGLFTAADDALSDVRRVFDPTDPECGRTRLELPIA
ncbi:MAG TPA: hypothetical protein VGI55_08870 [Solirubrobacteraceae bacterium]